MYHDVDFNHDCILYVDFIYINDFLSFIYMKSERIILLKLTTILMKFLTKEYTLFSLSPCPPLIYMHKHTHTSFNHFGESLFCYTDFIVLPWPVWLNWLEHCPVKQKVASLKPNQVTCSSWGLNPWSGRVQGNRLMFLSHLDDSPPLFFFSSPFSKINKPVLEWTLKKGLHCLISFYKYGLLFNEKNCYLR